MPKSLSFLEFYICVLLLFSWFLFASAKKTLFRFVDFISVHPSCPVFRLGPFLRTVQFRGMVRFGLPFLSLMVFFIFYRADVVAVVVGMHICC